MNINEFWQAVLQQDADKLRTYFHSDAYINWHCTNEHFTVEEFIKANCEYPGLWCGEIEKEVSVGDMIITATHIWQKDSNASFHATSFIQIAEGRIVAIDEYWGDDGDAPLWRKEMSIGSEIRKL